MVGGGPSVEMAPFGMLFCLVGFFFNSFPKLCKRFLIALIMDTRLNNCTLLEISFVSLPFKNCVNHNESF